MMQRHFNSLISHAGQDHVWVGNGGKLHLPILYSIRHLSTVNFKAKNATLTRTTRQGYTCHFAPICICCVVCLLLLLFPGHLSSNPPPPPSREAHLPSSSEATMALALALCTPTQHGACASGCTISSVCAYLRPLLLDVLRYTGASGRSRRPVMGPVRTKEPSRQDGQSGGRSRKPVMKPVRTKEPSRQNG